MAKPKTDGAWLAQLSLKDRILVHLSGAQSRFEAAIITKLRADWMEHEIRQALRELYREQHIDLDAIDRVRWHITFQGRNAAARARAAAKRKVAA